MEARAGNSSLDFETLFSGFRELLNGSGLMRVKEFGKINWWAIRGKKFHRNREIVVK